MLGCKKGTLVFFIFFISFWSFIFILFFPYELELMIHFLLDMVDVLKWWHMWLVNCNYNIILIGCEQPPYNHDWPRHCVSTFNLYNLTFNHYWIRNSNLLLIPTNLHYFTLHDIWPNWSVMMAFKWFNSFLSPLNLFSSALSSLLSLRVSSMTLFNLFLSLSSCCRGESLPGSHCNPG